MVCVDGIDQSVKIFSAAGLPEDAYQLSQVLTGHFAQGKPRVRARVEAIRVPDGWMLDNRA